MSFVLDSVRKLILASQNKILNINKELKEIKIDIKKELKEIKEIKGKGVQKESKGFVENNTQKENSVE